MNTQDLHDVIGSYVSGWQVSSVVLGKRRGRETPVAVLGICPKCKTKKRITPLLLRKKRVPKCNVCHPPKRKKKARTNYCKKYPREYRTWVEYVKDDTVKCWAKFPRFLYDMGEKPPGHALDRHNRKRKHSPTNSYYRKLEVRT